MICAWFPVAAIIADIKLPAGYEAIWEVSSTEGREIIWLFIQGEFGPEVPDLALVTARVTAFPRDGKIVWSWQWEYHGASAGEPVEVPP